MLTRRQALKRIGHLSATSALLPMSHPWIATADNRPTAPRLVVVLLRGGLDGLAAVPPDGDPDYARLRPQLAASINDAKPGGVKLDDQFGLHPAMAPLKAWYDAGELLIVHAIGLPHRHPSHAAAQHLLESGTQPAGTRDGWLNRALTGLSPSDALGLAVGRVVPLILQGQGSIRAFVPPRMPKTEEDVLQRLDALYANDPLFHQTFEKARPSINREEDVRWRWNPRARRPTLRLLAEEIGKLLAQPDGPRVAVLESHGWDTHMQQPTHLHTCLAQLVNGLLGLRVHLEPIWPQTLVLVVTEFGRTAIENRTAGTDHGAGSIALVLGGTVGGGRVAGSWPGLGQRDLLEGRALRPTTDLRSLFKATLREHLGLTEAFIEDHVFPNSRTIAPFAGLKQTF